MTRFSFLSRIFRFRSRRSAGQKTANPETAGLSRQQYSSPEPTQAQPAVTASNSTTPYYDHGVSPRSSPPPESATPIRVVRCTTPTAQPRSFPAGPVSLPLPIAISPAIPSPRIVQSPLTTSFPVRPTITDPAEISYVSPSVPLVPIDRHHVHLHVSVHQDGPLAAPPSESQWVAPTQTWGEHGPRSQNLLPVANSSPRLPLPHDRRRVTFQAPPRTRTRSWTQPPPEIRHPSEESLASSCSTVVPNTHFHTAPGSQAVPTSDTAAGSLESKSSTVIAAEATMADKELLAGCDSENESKNDALTPLLLQSPATLPPSRIRGSEKARRHASLFTGTPQHHHQQVLRSAKASRFSLPAPRARNADRVSFLPLPPSPGLGPGSTTKREKRQSRWSREVNKPETQDMLRMMASTGLSM